jgi:hypothetical protein
MMQTQQLDMHDRETIYNAITHKIGAKSELGKNTLDIAIKALEQNPYKDFCEFVAKMVLRDDFEENAGANAELLCRKLSKLGIVKTNEDKWVLAESEDEE